MKDMIPALIGLLGGVLTTDLEASWFTLDLLRFDVRNGGSTLNCLAEREGFEPSIRR